MPTIPIPLKPIFRIGTDEVSEIYSSLPTLEVPSLTRCPRRQIFAKMILPNLRTVVLLPLLFGTSSLASPIATTPSPDNVLAQKALDNVYKILNGTLKDGSTHTTCTKDNLVVRKE